MSEKKINHNILSKILSDGRGELNFKFNQNIFSYLESRKMQEKIKAKHYIISKFNDQICSWYEFQEHVIRVIVPDVGAAVRERRA
jgi:hypothetical protein